MKAHFFGGPAHLSTLEIDSQLTVLSLVVSKDKESEKTNVGLVKMGIEPPVGTYQAHYVFMAKYMEDRLYLFVGHEGEVPDGE